MTSNFDLWVNATQHIDSLDWYFDQIGHKIDVSTQFFCLDQMGLDGSNNLVYKDVNVAYYDYSQHAGLIDQHKGYNVPHALCFRVSTKFSG